jgi:hypothetical protein
MNRAQKAKQTKRIKRQQKYTVVPPKTISQQICRDTIDNLQKNIKVNHCRICGDTEDDGKLKKIQTKNEEFHLCLDCYNIQMNM